MASTRILKYKAAWHPKNNEGLIRLRLEGGETRKWTGKDPAEFAAILTILQGDDDPFLTEDGWVATGTEDPGEIDSKE